jgi:hypothetical protein
MSVVRLNLRPLRLLQSNLAGLSKSRVQVGLFAATASRTAEPGRIADNPSLGAIHEFGLSFSRKRDKATTTIPRRSFLEMPLTLYLAAELRRIGLSWGFFISSTAQHGGGAVNMLARLGKAGEDVVAKAFATGGFGHWPALAPETIRRKRSAAILIETKQMRDAVSSRVI